MSLISMSKIVSADKNPRTVGVDDYIRTPLEEFPEDFRDGIKALAESIDSNGLLQPIVVKDLGGGKRYRLLAGHRRFKAYQYLGKSQIDAKSVKGKAEDEPVIALIENTDREDLPPLDIAYGLEAIMRSKGITKQSSLAEIVNRSQAWVSQHLSLLSADSSVRDALEDGSLSFAGARSIVSLPKSEQKSAIDEAKKEATNNGADRVTTKGAKKAVKRNRKKSRDQQQTIRPLAEREREQRSEMTSSFVGEYWPDGDSPNGAIEIAGLFWDFLMDNDRLVIKS